MNKLAPPIQRRRRVALGIILGTVVIASLAGAFAYRQVFARPGEAALRLVPADSVFVASIDLTPSPAQALAFKHIDDSLSRNGMGKFLEKSVLDIFDHSKVTEALRPLVLRNGAICVEAPEGNGKEAAAVAFLAVTDGKQAAQILEKGGYPQFYKGTKYYKTGGSPMLVTVIDDLLVITDRPEHFLSIKAVRDGSVKSITTVPEYIAARSKVADDANIMLYMSPKLASIMIPGNQDQSRYPLPEWAAVGLAIRDGGIGLSFSGKMDVSKYASYKDIAQIPAVRSDLFQVLPTGSYGMIAVSDPSAYFNWIESSLKDDKDMAKGIAQAEDSVQKGIGLSVKEDLSPALKGDTVAALYPSEDGNPAGVDVLVVVDDTNTANPSDAVDRFKTFMEQQMAKEGNTPKIFQETSIQGGREYRINDKMQQDMRESLGHGMDDGTVKKDVLVGKKTVAYAIVGKAVLAASSQELLDRAVACYSSKTNGMTGDAKFSTSEKELLDGSQSFATFSLSRIAEGVKNTLNTSKMDGNNRKAFDSIIGMFQSLNDPFYVKGKSTPDGHTSGGVFIPLDYDKLIDLLGERMNNKQKD
jgi:hypothetical protein